MLGDKFGVLDKVREGKHVLVQEEAGIHVGISANLIETGRHAAKIMARKYQRWYTRDRHAAWGHYKRNYFTVAVGGGNTVKAQYRALIEHHFSDIEWVKHVRFFFLEDSTGEANWESPENALVMNLIVPLARKKIRARGLRALASKFDLPSSADEDDIIDHMVATLINPINLSEARIALDGKNRAKALQLAREESERYQHDIQKKLGGNMAFHCVISGIGKDGTLGAFSPYSPQLKVKEPGALVLKQGKRALRVALNRGVLINAETISLIVSGSLKLGALGRFEMSDSVDFEQTVMETPLRMLRETYDIARKVYIFADEQALHFDVTVFEYSERGVPIRTKAETRAGQEDNGIHILLMHGFMGLFSFISLLVRLPNAWTVSALHRGRVAKTLDEDEVFPHFARFLRKAMLKNWRQGRPVPIVGHSLAGMICDHLLLSLLSDYDDPIPPYESLNPENRQLVDALRTSGVIHLASWAPSDLVHTSENTSNLIGHIRRGGDLDYTGLERVYNGGKDNGLVPTEDAAVKQTARVKALDRLIKFPTSRTTINSLNSLIRYLLNNKTVQQRMLSANTPYVLRLVGSRLLKTASFYGLLKEINAAFHDLAEFQRRHLKALDIMIAYDIPFLSIVHEDDFLVSAGRHREEHDYLVARRKEKEGVSRKRELRVPARYLLLRREADELPVDPLNPHLMIMSTSTEGNTMAREVTAAITGFVNENVARAMVNGDTAPLPSVKNWVRHNSPPRRVGGNTRKRKNKARTGH